MNSVIIIGSGQAGLQVALSLREYGYEGTVTLFGDEPLLPYQRPPLSKGFLTGAFEQERLILRELDVLTKKRIVYINERVTSIDPENNSIATDNKKYVFDFLILALGGQARIPSIEGAELNGVIGLRSLADAQRIKEQSKKTQDVVVLGGGFIGLEVAASMRSLGKNVHVIEGADRLLNRVVCADMSQFFMKLHADEGVDFRLNTSIEKISGKGKVEQVILSDGEVIETQLVIVGVGLHVDESMMSAGGIACDRGALVNENAQTVRKNIYAIGDCSVQPHYRDGRMIRIESVQNAIDQAKKVAAHITGVELRNQPIVPWFWSDQFHVKWQMAGWNDPFDVSICRGGADKFSIFYLKNQRMQSVVSINSPADHMMARKLLLSADKQYDAKLLADNTVSLKSLL